MCLSLRGDLFSGDAEEPVFGCIDIEVPRRHPQGDVPYAVGSKDSVASGENRVGYWGLGVMVISQEGARSWGGGSAVVEVEVGLKGGCQGAAVLPGCPAVHRRPSMHEVWLFWWTTCSKVPGVNLPVSPALSRRPAPCSQLKSHPSSAELPAPLPPTLPPGWQANL